MPHVCSTRSYPTGAQYTTLTHMCAHTCSTVTSITHIHLYGHTCAPGTAHTRITRAPGASHTHTTHVCPAYHTRTTHTPPAHHTRAPGASHTCTQCITDTHTHVRPAHRTHADPCVSSIREPGLRACTAVIAVTCRVLRCPGGRPSLANPPLTHAGGGSGQGGGPGPTLSI